MIIGVVLSKMIDSCLKAPPMDTIMFILLFAIFMNSLWLIFVKEQKVISRVFRLEEKLSKITEHRPPNQYDFRKQHYAHEKVILVRALIDKLLPEIVLGENKNKKNKKNKKIAKTAVVVDSGTTLEQVLPKIKTLGLGPKIDQSSLLKLNFYTNSMSGSAAFCKAPSGYLSENQVHLFGGTQLEKYHSVSGPVTKRAMDSVKDEYKKNKGIIIGIITANWILVGETYDRLILCSTENEHLEYKKKLAQISDFLIIISPLGKLLSVNTSDKLNQMLKLKEEKKPEYEGFKIGGMRKRKKNNTFLLTTHRKSNLSVLKQHSDRLNDAYEEDNHKVYELWKKHANLTFDYKEKRDDQILKEIPHCYLKEHKNKVLQIWN